MTYSFFPGVISMLRTTNTLATERTNLLATSAASALLVADWAWRRRRIRVVRSVSRSWQNRGRKIRLLVEQSLQSLLLTIISHSFSVSLFLILWLDFPSFFFFRMAYLNAWLTSFIGYTLLCSLLGWTTRGRHHTPVSVKTVWLTDHFTGISPCTFARSELGSVTCIGCDSPIRGTDGLKSPPKDLAMRIKRLAKGRYCRGRIWIHAEPPVWKFAVYRLALRPLSHDSSSFHKLKFFL